MQFFEKCKSLRDTGNAIHMKVNHKCKLSVINSVHTVREAPLLSTIFKVEGKTVKYVTRNCSLT